MFGSGFGLYFGIFFKVKVKVSSYHQFIHPSNHPTIISRFFLMKHLLPLLPDLLPLEIGFHEFHADFFSRKKENAPVYRSVSTRYPPLNFRFASLRSGSLGIGGLSSFH